MSSTSEGVASSLSERERMMRRCHVYMIKAMSYYQRELRGRKDNFIKKFYRDKIRAYIKKFSSHPEFFQDRFVEEGDEDKEGTEGKRNRRLILIAFLTLYTEHLSTDTYRNFLSRIGLYEEDFPEDSFTHFYEYLLSIREDKKIAKWRLLYSLRKYKSHFNEPSHAANIYLNLVDITPRDYNPPDSIIVHRAPKKKRKAREISVDTKESVPVSLNPSSSTTSAGLSTTSSAVKSSGSSVSATTSNLAESLRSSEVFPEEFKDSIKDKSSLLYHLRIYNLDYIIDTIDSEDLYTYISRAMNMFFTHGPAKAPSVLAKVIHNFKITDPLAVEDLTRFMVMFLRCMPFHIGMFLGERIQVEHFPCPCSLSLCCLSSPEPCEEEWDDLKNICKIDPCGINGNYIKVCTHIFNEGKFESNDIHHYIIKNFVKKYYCMDESLLLTKAVNESTDTDTFNAGDSLTKYINKNTDNHLDINSDLC